MQELAIEDADQYVITFNGAVSKSVFGQVLKKNELSRSTYEKVEQCANDHRLAFNFVDSTSRIITSNHNIGWITVVQAWQNSAGLFV